MNNECVIMNKVQLAMIIEQIYKNIKSIII